MGFLCPATTHHALRFVISQEIGDTLNPRRCCGVRVFACSGAVSHTLYTGLNKPPGGDRLFAANAGAGRIDVFDSRWRLVGHFADPSLKTLAPYNVAVLDGMLFVAYAPPPGSSG